MSTQVVCDVRYVFMNENRMRLNLVYCSTALDCYGDAHAQAHAGITIWIVLLS